MGWLDLLAFASLSYNSFLAYCTGIICVNRQMNTIQLYPQAQQNTRTDWKTR